MAGKDAETNLMSKVSDNKSPFNLPSNPLDVILTSDETILGVELLMFPRQSTGL